MNFSYVNLFYMKVSHALAEWIEVLTTFIIHLSHLLFHTPITHARHAYKHEFNCTDDIIKIIQTILYYSCQKLLRKSQVNTEISIRKH